MDMGNWWIVLLIYGGILAILLIGAMTDLRTRRIPNWLTFGGAFVGLVVNVAVSHQQGAALSVFGWFVGVLLLLLPYVLGGTGAGDVKLLAAAGAWGGPAFALSTLTFGALAGGVYAIGYLIATGRLTPTIRGLAARLAGLFGVAPRLLVSPASTVTTTSTDSHTPPAVRPPARLPYGPALAIGGLIAVIVRF